MVAGYEQLHMCGMLHNILSSGGKNTKMATSLLEYVHEVGGEIQLNTPHTVFPLINVHALLSEIVTRPEFLK